MKAMKAHITLAAMALAALTGVALVGAQQPTQPTPAAGETAKVRDDVRLKEQVLSRQFAEFQDAC